MPHTRSAIFERLASTSEACLSITWLSVPLNVSIRCAKEHPGRQKVHGDLRWLSSVLLSKRNTKNQTKDEVELFLSLSFTTWLRKISLQSFFSREGDGLYTHQQPTVVGSQDSPA